MRLGLADASVVGGADTLCGSVLFGFNALQLVAQEACRPFDVARAGINLGEAAAIVLPNTEHAPVHIADVITAIGKLRKAKMDTQAISTALGYAELEIKRLEALAAVHPTVLKALRQGRLTLKQVRLFARLPDKKQQAEIAQTALDGYFQDYQLRAVVEHDRATVEDDRFTLVGMDRYLAAGGRVASDLFGEYPDYLLDPEVLQGAWRERVQPIVEHLKAEGLAGARTDMGSYTLVVVGADDVAGQPGFIVLADRADGETGDVAGGEQLQDHDYCPPPLPPSGATAK